MRTDRLRDIVNEHLSPAVTAEFVKAPAIGQAAMALQLTTCAGKVIVVSEEGTILSAESAPEE